MAAQMVSWTHAACECDFSIKEPFGESEFALCADEGARGDGACVVSLLQHSESQHIQELVFNGRELTMRVAVECCFWIVAKASPELFFNAALAAERVTLHHAAKPGLLHAVASGRAAG